MSRDATTFHQAVCTDCETSEGDPVTRAPRRRADLARINRDTHDQQNHDGVETAHVRTFDVESVGAVPVDEPPVGDGETAEVDVDE